MRVDFLWKARMFIPMEGETELGEIYFSGINGCYHFKPYIIGFTVESLKQITAFLKEQNDSLEGYQ